MGSVLSIKVEGNYVAVLIYIIIYVYSFGLFIIMILKRFIYILALILIISAFTNINGTLLVRANDNVEDVKIKFYALLDTLSAKSHQERIKNLIRFIRLNPKFTQVYHRLYDEYMSESKVDSAAIVFNQFLHLPDCRHNSLWIMAKIYHGQEKPLNAFKCYKELIQSGSISMPLLKDMVEFDHYWSGKYNMITHLKERNILMLLYIPLL